MAALQLTRRQILAFRRRAGSLDERLPAGKRSLRRAAWAGLQDSMPRAALLSIHARVQDTRPSAWEDPALVQVWGPRFSVYVVAAQDRAVFTLGRLPDDPKGRRRAEDLAERLQALLGDRPMPYGEAGKALGEPPNRLRYATTTGTVLVRWDGARKPAIWTVAPPEMDPAEARRELARRYLAICGPATAKDFGAWAGIKPRRAAAIFDELEPSLLPVRTPIGPGCLLAASEADVLADEPEPAPARLLPSGDAY